MSSPIAKINEYIDKLDMDLFGVASAELYIKVFPDKLPIHKYIPDARSIIVIGLRHEPYTMASVLHPEWSGLAFSQYPGDEREVLTEASGLPQARTWFLSTETQTLLRELDMASHKLARFIRGGGFRCFRLPVNSSAFYMNRVNISIPFDIDDVLYLAGLGNKGLNKRFLTKKYGPRFRAAALITDLPLEAGSPIDEPLCTRCGICVESCPAGAIDTVKGRDMVSCSNFGSSGVCMAICPVGELTIPKDPKENTP
jgi:epoxyqueuosine reductase QueG